MINPLWADVRFLLYPVLVTAGASWALLFWRRYRRMRIAGSAWAAWLGLAVAIEGVCGFGGLAIALELGFSTTTSLLATVGIACQALVLVSGALALGVSMWRQR